jgi:inorganic phosphate transporter, PiT family
VGLLLGASAFTLWNGTLLVAGAMALGGLAAAWRVARTLSLKVTTMNEGQGLAGNLGTSLLVTGASWMGLPVSTTHVATGSIVGVGSAGGKVRWETVAAILASWLVTVPLAAALGAAAAWFLL